MNFSGPITMAAWAKPQSTSGLQDIIAHGYTSSPAAEVFLRINNGNYEAGYWNGGAVILSVPIPAGDLNTWVHLAVVYDGSNWNLYRNGQLGASAASTTGAIQVGADWSIGSDAPSNPSDPRSFQGSIGEVYIDSVPLNQQQVQALMNATPPAAPTGLTATGVSTSEIDLAWANNASNATAHEVWQSSDGTAYTLLATLAGDATSYAHVGLSEATDVAYAIRTIAGTGAAFGTPVFGTTLPAAPTALVATANNAEADLSWVNNSSNPTVFNVYRSADGVDYSQIATVGGDTTTYQDLDSWNGSMNYYKVTAVNDGEESAPSNIASVEPIAKLQLVDDPATAPPDQSRADYTVLHGQTLTITDPANGILANDTDPNGYRLAIGSYTDPSSGTLTLNSDGTFVYTADPYFAGTVTFTYTATDQVNATSNTATVTIEVTDQMPEATSMSVDLPVYVDDGSSGYGYGYGGYDYYSGPVSGTLSAFDPDGDPLTFTTSADNTDNFQINSSGNFTYTPSNGDHSTVVITFYAYDGVKYSNKATLIIRGWHIDYNEDAQEGEPGPDGDDYAYDLIPSPGGNLHYSLLENQTLQVDAPGVLGGAGDPDPPPDSDQPSIEAMIEPVMHGTMVKDSTRRVHLHARSGIRRPRLVHLGSGRRQQVRRLRHRLLRRAAGGCKPQFRWSCRR